MSIKDVTLIAAAFALINIAIVTLFDGVAQVVLAGAINLLIVPVSRFAWARAVEYTALVLSKPTTAAELDLILNELFAISNQLNTH